MTIVTDYTAILAINDESDARWNVGAPLRTGAVVTYSFLAGAQLPAQSELYYGATGSTSLTAAQKTSFRKAVKEYADATGLVFVEVPNGRAAMIDVFNVIGTGNVAGYANYPEASRNDVSTGDIAFGMSGSWAPGTWQYAAVLHELGHAVGLQHPHDGSKILQSSKDSQAFTLQSYNFVSPNADELGPLDEAALAHMYGNAQASEDWTATWNSSTFKVEVRLDTGHNRIITTEDDTKVMAYAGNDVVFGRNGDDQLMGLHGNDGLHGGGGADRLWGQVGNDKLYGNQGNDWLSGGQGRDTLFGGTNNDTLLAGAQADILRGGAGGDKLFGNAGHDKLFGEVGDDFLRGHLGNDHLNGGLGQDSQYGDFGNDRLFGGSGNDKLFGASGNDRLFGQLGDDVLFGGTGRDALFGGLGADTLNGGLWADTLSGEAGDDRLFGGGGNDLVWGGSGHDILYGEGGADRLNGGAGNDVMTGGWGDDWFAYGRGADRIRDWSDGETIEIHTAGLTSVGATPSAVVAAATVVDGNTVLDFGDGNSLTLVGLTTPSLLTDDLVLV